MTVGEALCAVMDDSLVYRKSGLGVAQLAATHGGALSPRERHVLILLDGRRTIGELSGIFGGETVQRVVPELQAKGFAKQVDATLAADWANAITQIQVGPRERPRRQPAPERVSNANPMTWIALVIVLVSYWATNRYISQADAASWQLPAMLPKVATIDALGVPTSTDAVAANGRARPTPVTIKPISGLPAKAAVKSPATASPARAAPQAAARDRQAPVSGESGGAARSHASASAARGPSLAALEPSNVKLDKMASAWPLPPQVASAAPTSAAPIPSPTEAPVAVPAPVAPADPPASAPETEVAMHAPPAQPASDAVGLRPLAHDPPRFPERALRDGITESHVRARLWVTAEGKVDQVDVIEATPSGVFDDEVRRALSLWSFEAPGHPTEQVVELTLKP